MPSIVAEDESLLKLHSEGEVVREIEVCMNIDCTTIDERIIGLKCGVVFEN